MVDGPTVNAYDGLAGLAWVVAAGLIVADLAFFPGNGMGPLTPFGGLVGLAAVTLTVMGIARRAQSEILSQMHHVFAMGRESVRELKR